MAMLKDREDAAAATVGTVGTLSMAAVGTKHTSQTELMSEQTGFFDAPPLEAGMLGRRERTIRPLESLDGSNREFTFPIPAYSSLYMNSRLTRLQGSVFVEKSLDNGTNWSRLDSTDLSKVSLHQFFACTMWESAQVMVKGSVVSTVASKDYPYKSFIENLLSFDKASSEFHQVCAGYAPDKAGCFDKLDDGPYKTRSEWITKGNGCVGFSTPLNIDFLNQSRLMVDNMPMTIILRQGDHDFNLKTAASTSAAGRTIYRLRFEQLEIKLFYNELQPAIKQMVDSKMQSGARARYPQHTTIIKSQTMPKGTSEFVWDNAINGKLPHCVIACFVLQKSWQGGPGAGNPFYFPSLSASDVFLTVNNVDVPLEHYKPSFDSNDRKYITAYGLFVDNFVIERNSSATSLVNPELWKDGMT